MKTYKIRRGKEEFGPYTIQELRNYIDAGNIIDSDEIEYPKDNNWISVAAWKQVVSSDSVSKPVRTRKFFYTSIYASMAIILLLLFSGFILYDFFSYSNYYTTTALLVRKQPHLSSQRIFLLPYGTKVSAKKTDSLDIAYQKKAYWYKLRDIDGYVFGEFLSRYPVPERKEYLELYNNTDHTNLPVACELERTSICTHSQKTRFRFYNHKAQYILEDTKTELTPLVVFKKITHKFIATGTYKIKGNKIIVTLNKEKASAIPDREQIHTFGPKKTNKQIEISYYFQGKKSVFVLNKVFVSFSSGEGTDFIPDDKTLFSKRIYLFVKKQSDFYINR